MHRSLRSCPRRGEYPIATSRLGSRFRGMVQLQILERGAGLCRRLFRARAAFAIVESAPIWGMVGPRRKNPIPDGTAVLSDARRRGLAVEQSSDHGAGSNACLVGNL